VTEEMLEQAKRNLREELVFFGLTERFDESLVLAKQRLGFRSILYKSSGRVNTKRPRGDEVSEELAAAAERCNRYDIELYRYAEELFDGAPELRELDFQVELAALRLARDEGEADLDRPAPAGFGGDEEAWRMLVGTRATLLQREWSFVRDHRSEATSTVHDDDLEGELEDARLRTEELEQEVGRLSKAAESRMNAHSDRLKVARARTRELEQEVKRLRSADARVAELEQELKRLEAADSRVAELERDVNRLEAANSRVAELEREVERLETAKAKLKRDSKRGAKAGKSRPKRDAKRGGAKRSGAPRTKKATPHGAARRKERTPPTADAGAVSRGASDG
jgi:DNA repair exonuclease SbcCD ATPase subunit